MFIIACLLIPIIGIGLYPKIVTQIYDATTHQLTERLRNSVPSLVEEVDVASAYNMALKAPNIK